MAVVVFSSKLIALRRLKKDGWGKKFQILRVISLLDQGGET